MGGKTAFLFPGQGSQSIGMMSGLAADFPLVKDTFAEASSILGYDLWEICQRGPLEQLNRTDVTQPAMLAAGVATWRAWSIAGGDPDWMAGHSLGEYSALVAAGVMDYSEAVATVAQRGNLMQAATPQGSGAMAAVLGLGDAELDEICKRHAGDEVVSCANFNAPGQVVIAGHSGAVESVCAKAREAGARRAIMLPVSVPSHCALMKPAAGPLEEILAAMHFAEARCGVVQNADVKVHSTGAAMIDALARQLWQPVRWTETIQYLVDSGVDRFVECGPGRVLAGLNRRISRAAEIVALTDGDALSAASQVRS